MTSRSSEWERIHLHGRTGKPGVDMQNQQGSAMGEERTEPARALRPSSTEQDPTGGQSPEGQ